MEIRDILTLDDNNKYIISSKIHYNEKDHYCLVNINNPIQLMFCYEDNDDLVEITDKKLITKLLPLFLKASENMLNSN